MRSRTLTPALYLFGILNAVLYASLLPLWEGFDEPFHYASVAYVSRHARFPVLGKAGLSEEIRASLELAPASHVVRQNLPYVTTFEEFFSLEPAERARRRAALWAIPPALGARTPEDGTNYEAQQAPLAYLLLAPFDRAWAAVPLPARVWRLRLICGIAAVMVALWATLALARRLRVAPPFGRAAAFLVVTTQMFYAATAHVANDWLAVALMPVLLLAAVAYQEAPSRKSALWLGLALAAGLLTKAYFLALIPLALALAWVCRRGAAVMATPVLLLAGPWYLRNWALYGNLTGLMGAITRHSVREVAGAALSIPWGKALASYARRALWTANNSFDTFSTVTLDILLMLVAAAAGCWMYKAWKHRPAAAELVVAGGVFLFFGTMVYSISNLYLTFGAAAFGSGTWYAPALFGPVFVLLACGLEPGGRPGRVLLSAMLACWAYVLAATWWLKLIPLYGGYPGRVRLKPVAVWYAEGRHMLDGTALVSPPVLMAMAGVSAAAAFGLAAVLAVRLFRKPGGAVDGFA